MGVCTWNKTGPNAFSLACQATPASSTKISGRWLYLFFDVAGFSNSSRFAWVVSAATRLSKIGGFYVPSTPGDHAKNVSMKQKVVSYLLIQIRWLTKNYTSAYFSIVHTILIAEASDFLFLGGGVVRCVPELRANDHPSWHCQRAASSEYGAVQKFYTSKLESFVASFSSSVKHGLR
jgi:hypothetical protein